MRVRVTVERVDGLQLLLIIADVDIAMRALAETLARWDDQLMYGHAPRITVDRY